MASVTLDHYLAGVIGLGLIRNWYADGVDNAARLAELAEVLAKGKELPYSLELSLDPPIGREVVVRVSA